MPFRLSLSLILLLFLPAAAAASPPAAVALAFRDSLSIPIGIRETTRWFWVPTWLAPADKKRLWQSLSSQCNRLSREALIVPPPLILADGTVRLWPAVAEQDWAQLVLVRVNLVDYRWDPKVWDKLGFRNILFNTVLTETVIEETLTTYATDGRTLYRRWPGDEWILDSAWKGAKTRKSTRKIVALAPAIAETEEQRRNLVGLLTALTSAKGFIPAAPIVDGNYFLWETSQQFNRDLGYYGLIEVRDQKTYEFSIGYDPKARIDPAFFDTLLSAVTGNRAEGISVKNRRIARYEKFGGGYWATFDNDIALNERNPLRFLDGGFQFKATETFAHLANGFWAYGLFDNNGVRQDSAPDFVGFNRHTRSNDGKINIGLNCQFCHLNGGLNDIQDWFRPTLRNQRFLQTVDANQLKQLQKYGRPLEPYLERDRFKYETSVKIANGLDSKADVRIWADLFYAYDANVTMERAARDSGLAPADFTARLQKHLAATKYADTVLEVWTRPAADQQPVHLDDYTDSFNSLQLALRGLSLWPDSVRQAIIVKPGR
jgi:hypothetical protein